MNRDYENVQRLRALKEVRKAGSALRIVDSVEAAKKKMVELFKRKLNFAVRTWKPGEKLFARAAFYIIDSKKYVRRAGRCRRPVTYAYQKWREAVVKRDDYKCRECGSTDRIAAHHVKQWSLYPELRYDLENGKTLCRRCHGIAHPHISGLIWSQRNQQQR